MERASKHVGQRVLRVEDERMLRGAGRFVDDVDLPGQVWMRVVRSTIAHAHIVGVDVSQAHALRGVHAVLTGEDVAHVEPIPLRMAFEGIDLDPYLQPVLARRRVRYVGDPVAVVVADDPYLAEDAADLVRVDYDELEPVLSAADGVAPGAPALREGTSNAVVSMTRGYGEIARAFSEAATVVSAVLSVGRHTGVPLETRGLVADWDTGRRHLTIWGATLVAHYHRTVLSRLLGLPLNRITYRSTDSGGSFGVRGDVYPEDFLVAHLSIQLRRPVKWVEDRSEHLVATSHAREQTHRAKAAFDADGRLLGLRDEIWHDKGGYIRPTGVLVADITLGILPGPYRLPAYEGTIHAVTTTKTPIGPYRAPGRYQTTFARERLLDLAAAELGIDPLELRRRNLLAAADLPWEPGHVYHGEPYRVDVGDFLGLLEKAVERSGFRRWREEADRLRRDGRLLGNGISYWIDKSGLGGYETGGVDVDPSGAIRVLTGGASTGQGIETGLAQIAADELGVDPRDIEVVYGDTDLVPDGVGSWSSRSIVFGGSAVRLAAQATAEKARRVAGELLEVALDDLRVGDGRVFVAGSPDRGLTLGEIASACDVFLARRLDTEPGLGARRVYFDNSLTYPYGANLVQVELDPDTGNVRVRRCFVACEAGRAVNPLLLEGQAAGGMAQGLGGALLEEFRYDESGQPRCVSFADYLLPGAAEVPPVDVLVLEDAPSPSNPLGAKGMGESGIVGMGAAIASAVDDALGLPGAISELPIRPERVHALIATAANAAAVRGVESGA